MLFKKDDKKEEKVKEPQYYLSATNIQTLNYKVYYMSKTEKILYFLLAFALGAAVGYLFYGGIGKDEFGQPTTTTHILNILIPSAVGIVAGFVFLKIRTEQIINKRISQLKTQFRDMLESLNTSLGAGKNVVDSFYAVREDLKVQYDDAFIINELDVILDGMNNNIDIEDLLFDFGERSGLDDIKSFANVFRISYRKGGNIKDVIRSTHEILTDKMEIAEDIETVVTGSKNEQNIMTVMPIALVAMLKFTGGDFGDNFATPAGIASTTVALVMFVIAYFVGKTIMKIKV